MVPTNLESRNLTEKTPKWHAKYTLQQSGEWKKDRVRHTMFGYRISTGRGRQAEKLSREIWDSGWILQHRQVPTIPTVLLNKSILGRKTGLPVVQVSAIPRTTNQSWRFLGSDRGALPISRQENVGGINVSDTQAKSGSEHRWLRVIRCAWDCV